MAKSRLVNTADLAIQQPGNPVELAIAIAELGLVDKIHDEMMGKIH